MALLCKIGLHLWQDRPDELGPYGMGLERFNMQECERCGVWRDRVNGIGKDGKMERWHRTDRPPAPSSQKIIDGLKEAVAGRLARVTIDGETWARLDDIHADLQALMQINNDLRDALLSIRATTDRAVK
jgi:hypothetical protein